VTKRFERGLSLEAGGEYYVHKGSLKLGGGGAGDYADFHDYTLSAALKVDLSAMFGNDAAAGTGSGDSGTMAPHDHAHHAGHATHAGHAGPAGLMEGHLLDRAGDYMVGYHYMYGRQSGDLLHRSKIAGDRAIVANGGCDNAACSVKPREMSMHMHMVDVMYAPADWLTLMFMPQFVDMNMSMKQLVGGAPGIHSTHTSHQTGGVGDTEIAAMLRLFDLRGNRAHLTLAFTAPTGDSGITLNPVSGHNHDSSTVKEPEFLHYGMQLGSGTWDFKPSLTYAGRAGRWSWGGQLSGTQHLEARNEWGYAFGDSFQSTAWGGVSLLDWLSASVRGAYTVQGAVNGAFPPHASKNVTTGIVTLIPNSITGPMDAPASYGGRFWDVGFGIDAVVPGDRFKGNSLGLEWLQPVADDVNGYQLERKGQLFATWRCMF
jgi:hypothetical protein